MSTEVRIILSATFIGLFLLCKLLLAIVKKKHREDPVHMEEQRRREEEYRKRVERENEELQQYGFYDNDFSDADYVEKASQENE